MKTRILVLWFALFLAVPLFARDKSDVLIMRNGDRVTCEIKSLVADTLYISVDYILSTLSVEWSKVDHVESKQLFIVKTQDGRVYSGTLSTPRTIGARPTEIQILDSSNATVNIDKTEIIKMDETSSNLWQRFNGNVGLGITYNKGNQSTQYNLNSAVNYSRERWSTGASYDSILTANTGATTSTRNELDLNLQRLLRWNNWYYAGLADFLQSSVQGIQLQTTVGSGIGRYLKNNNHTVISVVGGLAWQRISYQQAILPSTTQNVASGFIGSQVKFFYFNRTNFVISTYLLPAISEAGRVHFNLNAAYYVKLWSNLTWNVSFYGDWDNRPPPGFSASDYGASSGVSWRFGNR